MTCIICDEEVRNGFSYFCRFCYRQTHKQLPITTLDLKQYLELSFNRSIKINNGWNFKMIHRAVMQSQPSLGTLAVVLEKVLFLKLASCRDLDLKNCHC